VRWSLLRHGRMPNTENLSYQWYDTPNIHLCTILDFTDLCRSLGITVERAVSLDAEGRVRYDAGGLLANWLGEQAVFLLKRG
jgi:methionine biosynthesis protein MetW